MSNATTTSPPTRPRLERSGSKATTSAPSARANPTAREGVAVCRQMKERRS